MKNPIVKLDTRRIRDWTTFFTMRHALIALFLAAFWCAGPSFAADAEWKVGVAQAKITPEKPMFLQRYPTKPFEKVESDLYVKALVLEDAEGFRAVLLTCDLLGLRYEDVKKVVDQIQKTTGMKREQILLCCSLAITTPILGHPSKPRGGMTEADAKYIGEYTDRLGEQFADVTVRAAAKLEPARISWGAGKVNFVVNRRVSTPKGIVQGVNPDGVADRTVPVLRVEGADGKPLAVVFGAAADANACGDANVLCADYPGFAQDYVHEKCPSAQAMFIIGCAGDANPYPRGSMELARKHGATLGKEVCRLLETPLAQVHGPLRVLYELAELPCAAPSREELEQQAKQGGDVANRALRLLHVLDRGYKLSTRETHPFAMWQFGQDLTLAALPGQVVAEYVPMIESKIGPDRLWLAGNCNDQGGYHIPTAHILAEEGLEARGFYSPKVEETVVAKVRELAEKIGRVLP